MSLGEAFPALDDCILNLSPFQDVFYDFYFAESLKTVGHEDGRAGKNTLRVCVSTCERSQTAESPNSRCSNSQAGGFGPRGKDISVPLSSAALEGVRRSS